MSKHTPGSWKIEQLPGNQSIEVQGEDGGMVAMVWSGIKGRQGIEVAPIIEANARLIAAAPELLEALEQAFVALGRAGGNTIGMGAEVNAFAKQEIRKAWETARAAIAKASKTN